MKQLLSLLLLLAVPFAAMAQEMREPENVITVTGTAQVFASPDEAMVRFGVMKEAPTASEAQSKASAVVTKMLAELAKFGIEKKDIQTSRMSLYPAYSQPKPGEPARIVGYQAQNMLSIRLTNFDLIGKVIDAGIAAGVNNVEGIDFRLRNSRGPRADAYKEAVADARSKADAIAEALGKKITGVYDVRADSGGYGPMPPVMGIKTGK